MTDPAIRSRPPWPTPWPEVNRAVERFRDGVGEVLGDRLVGLYLHGSLALGDFYPPASDVDWEFRLGRSGPTWVLDRWVTREHGWS